MWVVGKLFEESERTVKDTQVLTPKYIFELITLLSYLWLSKMQWYDDRELRL